MARNTVPYVLSAIAILLVFQIYRSNFSFPENHLSPGEHAKAHGPSETTTSPVLAFSQEPKVDELANEETKVTGKSEFFKEIDYLIATAETGFQSLLSRQSNTLEHAARAYREKRGRHPPPGFDVWFEYAQQSNAVIVEEFWDQIYHDLEPFWAISPAVIRAQARNGEMAVFVQDGVASTKTDWFWHQIWRRMIQEVAHLLPDMIIPLNPMDEPRILAPFTDINDAMSIATAERSMPAAADVKQIVQSWRESGEAPVSIPKVKWLEHKSPYSLVRAACDPHSPIHTDLDLQRNGKNRQHQLQPNDNLAAESIFVKNSTVATDTCSDPEIAAYHAAVLTPLTTKSSETLQPLFGGSKLSVNNDILLPAPMYWNGEPLFEQPDYTPWSQKSNTVVWRGTASGGQHNAFNWYHFHRHRFVALNNGTKYAVSNAAYDKISPPADRRSATGMLPLDMQFNLAKYLSATSNVGFTDLSCDIPGPEGTCWYLNDEFAINDMIGLSAQYMSKIVPDIDGNSFSGRYRSFLMSGSLPFKATLFREWHDSRLMAWKHYIPMSNKFTEYYSLLAYFLGCSEEVCGPSGAFPGREKEAEAIAAAGSEWARKVLRKEDMHVYIGRLLLEYGRITDDNRKSIGWVADLLPKSSDSTSQEVNVETGPSA